MSGRRGWCPTVHAPMETGDGLLVRIKPPCGRIHAEAATRLAEAAQQHGNGLIDLTSRAALQIRGLSAESSRRFAAFAVAEGLARATPAAERRRNVITPPLAGLDPACDPAAERLALALEAALADAEGLDELPDKFGVLVDGGGMLSPMGLADVIVRLRSPEAVVLSAPFTTEVRVPVDAVVGAVLDAARAASRTRRPVFAGAGQAFAALGDIRFGRTGVAICAAGPFGRLEASVLREVVALAARYADGMVRLTTWRAVCIAAPDRGRGELLRAGLAGLGLIIDPTDPLLLVSACPGREGCAAATVSTRTLAARLQPEEGVTMHVSGCQKGCAHPMPATVTVVGRDGKWDLVRNGRASDPPLRRGLSDDEVLAL